ncbi:hypothetical protein F7734_16875 [Scytonema sp. UIC 10036]|uniref:hypothetical protein n=1 Tax=Scytonema sp. UIC 10036 TaxID=2304196 RepID=UPI0012DA18AF|nr:hypothetical protein [Scytonema sp. UIC 10036]MUG93975.1 hypothetical protein [Scytonema sp. UIC 10036]
MSPKLIVPDFVIAAAVGSNPLSTANTDFLKYTDTIPKDWELAQQPRYTNSSAQLNFVNGISMTAGLNQVAFIEPLGDRSLLDISIPEIAGKYAQALPKMDFEAVGINFRGYVSFAGSQDAARKYVVETLLSQGVWQSEGEELIRASLNLVYKFQRAPLYLSITEAALRNEDETTTPIVMFGGSFSYELSGDSGAEKINSLHQAIGNWTDDLKGYSELINNKFLARITETISETPATVPDLFTMRPTSIA